MGWTFMNSASMGANPTPKAYLDQQCTRSPNTDTGAYGLRVIKSVYTSSGYFAAVEEYLDLDTKPAFAIICLVKWRPKARSDHFGYKDMTEDMGPYEHRCPASVLDALGETDNAIAIQWRQQARTWNEMRRRRKPLPGEYVQFDPPVRMTDDCEAAIFRVVDCFGSIAFQPMNSHNSYTIKTLMNRRWKIIPDPNHKPHTQNAA